MSDDFSALRRAARSSFCLWGGRFNPFLPVDRPELASALAALFRVDALFPLSQDPAVDAFMAAQRHISCPLFRRGLFSPTIHEGEPSANFADVTHPIMHAYNERGRSNPDAAPAVDIYQWDDADPLADPFLLTYGRTLTPDATGADYEGLMRQHLLAATTIIAPGGEIAPLHRGRMTLSAVGRDQMWQHHTVRNNWHFPGYYVGSAANFLDLVHFWNLRAADIPLYFFDPDQAGRYATFADHFNNQLEGLTTHHHQRRPALWHRPELAIETLALPVSTFSECNVDDPLWNGLNVRPPVMIFGEGSALGAIARQNDHTTLTFAIPPKPFFKDSSTRMQQYVLSIDPGIGLYGNEQETLLTPSIPQLNQLYGRESLLAAVSSARGEDGALGVIVPIYRDDLSQRALPTQRLITEIFATAGVVAEPSQAGLIGTTLIRQMGRLQNCRVFKIPGVRTLIERHGPAQSFSRSTAKQVILGQGSDRTLKEFQTLYIEYREPGVGLTNDSVLEYLLDREVFRPGLMFRCGNCQLEFWRSLDDAKTHIDCEYCGHTNNAARQLHDKDWAFRRSGLFGRDDHQGGAIPVVLALLALDSVAGPDGALYSMAMEFRSSGAAIPVCETDFIFMPNKREDGRHQIAIGECKTRRPIEARDVANLLAVANAFPAAEFDVFLVFAKLAEFTAEELAHIRTVNEPWKERAILLTERELEAMMPYERFADELGAGGVMISLSNMAQASARLFLDEGIGERGEHPA